MEFQKKCIVCDYPLPYDSMGRQPKGRYCRKIECQRVRKRLNKRAKRAPKPPPEPPPYSPVQPDGSIVTPFGHYASIFEAEAAAAKLDLEDEITGRDTCPADIEFNVRGKRASWREWWLIDIADVSSNMEPGDWFDAFCEAMQ